MSVNPSLRPEKLYATLLSGGELFTILDLSQEYNQLPLHLESRKLVRVNTHRGLY